MAGNKNRDRDLRLLQHMRDRQNDLANDVAFYGVTHPSNLTVSPTIRASVRRGLVQLVGDIFELTKDMKDETKGKIGINTVVIREFRNKASHNYGILTNEMAFACIKHCIDKTLRQNVIAEIARLKAELSGK